MSAQTNTATNTASTATNTASTVTNTAAIATSVAKVTDPFNITLRGGTVDNCARVCYQIQSTVDFSVSNYVFNATATYTYPVFSVSNRALYLRSSSTNDVDTTGTGAWTIYLYLVTAAGVGSWQGPYSLNGTTVVSLGSSYNICEGMKIATAGSLLQNDGTIRVGTSNPPTGSDVQCECYVGAGQTRGPWFMIAGKVTTGLYLQNIYLATERAGPVRVAIFVLLDTGVITNVWTGTVTSSAQVDLRGVDAILPTMVTGETVQLMGIRAYDQGTTGTQMHTLSLSFFYD